MRSYTISRSRTLALAVGVLASLVCAAASAGDYKTEYDKKIKAAQNVGVLGDGLAGDTTNLYTGATTFSATDLSLPTNALGLSLSRTYAVEYDHDVATVKGTVTPYVPEIFSTRKRLFGDWDLDVPHISTTMSQTTGWVVDSATPTKRCSVVGQTNSMGAVSTGLPPKALGSRSWPFSAGVYWSGYSLHVPGGDQSMLVASLPNTERPSSGGPYHWTTNKDWWISCLTTAANDAGEGYVARSPDGMTYTFNWLSRRNVTAVSEYDEELMQSQNPAYLFRAEYMMLPTRIEDRFGNWITYTWSSDAFARLLSMSAGPTGSAIPEQTITLTYNPQGHVATASDGTRTWTYTYPGNEAILGTVTLPDSSFWTYGLDGVSPPSDDLLPICNADPNYDPVQRYWLCFGGGDTPTYTAVGTVKHPSGALVTFTFDLHYQYSPNAIAVYPIGLTQKTITGPGLTPATWYYDYLPSKAEIKTLCQANNCPVRLMTDEVSPDNSITRRIYGLQLNVDESVLLGQLDGSLTPNGGGSPAITTSTRWGADILDDPAPSTGTVPTWYRELQYHYVPSNQATPYTVRVGVNPLFYALTQTQVYASERRLPVAKRALSQQAVTFTNETTSFDAYARPTSISRYSSGSAGGNFSKYETVTYHNNLAKWVVGQVATTNCVISPECAGGKAVSKTDYDSVTAMPLRFYAFDMVNPTETISYNASGTISQVKDGKNNATSLAGWTRGIPTLITFASGSTISAGVGTRGLIDWTRNEFNSRTCYEYDLADRIKKITHTDEALTDTCAITAWNPSMFGFTNVGPAEYGLPANQWRQTVETGLGKTTTYFDARWQPVLSRTEDTSNVLTRSFVVTRYDGLGRQVFKSYPVDSLTSINDTLKGVRTSYDGLGRVVQVQQDSEPVGGQTVLNTTTSYLSGFQARVTNPRGFQTVTNYQVFDSPSTDAPLGISLPEGVWTTITRDIFGKPKSVSRSGIYAGNPLGLTRYYVYDANERLCKAINPESGATVVDYDLAGNVIWSADGLQLPTLVCDRVGVTAGQQTWRVYDAMNRVTAVNSPSGTADVDTTYFADGTVNTLTAANPGGNSVNTTYTYNRRRLFTRESLQVNALAPWC